LLGEINAFGVVSSYHIDPKASRTILLLLQLTEKGRSWRKLGGRRGVSLPPFVSGNVIPLCLTNLQHFLIYFYLIFI